MSEDEPQVRPFTYEELYPDADPELVAMHKQKINDLRINNNFTPEQALLVNAVINGTLKPSFETHNKWAAVISKIQGTRDYINPEASIKAWGEVASRLNDKEKREHFKKA